MHCNLCTLSIEFILSYYISKDGGVMEFIFPDGFSVILTIVSNDWLDTAFSGKTKMNYGEFVLLAGKAMPESDEFILIVDLWRKLLEAHKEIVELHKKKMEECDLSFRTKIAASGGRELTPGIIIGAEMIEKDAQSLVWNKKETELFTRSLHYTLSRIAVLERLVDRLSTIHDTPHTIVHPVTRACARICSARSLDSCLDTLTEIPNVLNPENNTISKLAYK